MSTDSGSFRYPLTQKSEGVPSQEAAIDKATSVPEGNPLPGSEFKVKTITDGVEQATPREPYKADAKDYVPVKEVDTPDAQEYRTTDNVISGYIRFTPISGGIFYKDGANFSVRRLLGSDIQALAVAGQADSTTLLLDAIGPSLHGIDVRFLTPGDFKHLLYHHRTLSFPKRPWIRRWTSLYGNDNEIQVKDMGEVKFKTPKISHQEYLDEFVSKGLAVPLMRDAEYFELFSPKAIADKYIWSQAQYFQGDTFKDKLANYHKSTGDIIALAVTLKELSEHGVVEEIECIDQHFDPRKWVIELKERSRILESAMLDYMKLDYDAKVIETKEILLNIADEIAEIEADLAAGKEVRPEKETILVPLSAATFLSGL